MTNRTYHPDAQLAYARIRELTEHTDACDRIDPYRPDDAHDIADEILRDLLITDDDESLPHSEFDFDYYRNERNADALSLDIDALIRDLADALTIMRTDYSSIQTLSIMRLEQSLCPMHHCDYCACFDDDDPECATIRAYFPNHDT